MKRIYKSRSREGYKPVSVETNVVEKQCCQEQDRDDWSRADCVGLYVVPVFGRIEQFWMIVGKVKNSKQLMLHETAAIGSMMARDL